MGRKHKHEEHANHERWVISYADMVTLLFALFVVLYALGEVKLKKLKDLKKSVAFAFAFEGEGKTKDEGIFDRGDTGGDVIEGVPLLNAQDGEMLEYLLNTLPEVFEERVGKSLDVEQTDDTVRFTAPISDFYPRYDGTEDSLFLTDAAYEWIRDLLKPVPSFANQVTFTFEVPEVTGGLPYYRDQRPISTDEVTGERIGRLTAPLVLLPRLNRRMLLLSQRPVDRRYGDWEDLGTLVISFNNSF